MHIVLLKGSPTISPDRSSIIYDASEFEIHPPSWQIGGVRVEGEHFAQRQEVDPSRAVRAVASRHQWRRQSLCRHDPKARQRNDPEQLTRRIPSLILFRGKSPHVVSTNGEQNGNVLSHFAD